MKPEIRSSSPSGRYLVRVLPWEPRMSLWIETPEIFDTISQVRLLQFLGASWSLDAADWVSDCTVTLQLRKFPGDHSPRSVEAIINCASQTATVQGLPVSSLAAVEAALDKIIGCGVA